jgi:hypothetical protein
LQSAHLVHLRARFEEIYFAKMMDYVVTILAFVAALSLGTPQQDPVLGPVLSQVQAFSRREGEALWPGYGTAPYGFLLLETDGETMLCWDSAPAGFRPAGRDPATDCPRFTRPRSSFPATYLAAMPIFGPPAVIVMGTPASTGLAPAEWLRTILHEHFHQWEWSLPDYYTRVAALDLTGGDESGMWMLNYRFPYDDAVVGARYAAAATALADALQARGTPGFPTAFDRYLGERARFEAGVSARDWRYLELELWQEGVARWTETELGKVYPDAGVRAASASLEASTLAALRTPNLTKQRRQLVYPYGAAEAMLMAACGPAWRSQYRSVLSLKPLLAAARTECETGLPNDKNGP